MLALTLGVVVLFRSPPDAANLDITPDAVEYVVGAERIVHLGRYTIEVAGIEYPPRYPPFFSLMLAPFIWLGKGAYGVAILPVFALGLFAVFLSFSLGVRAGNLTAGCMAGAGLLLQPMIRFWGKQVMTDIPFVALTLLAAFIFLHAVTHQEFRLRTALAIGFTVALAMALRPVGLALLGPFFLLPLLIRKPWKQWLRLAFGILVPVALLLLIQHAYNNAVFGSSLRNGYHFWTPVPYDYPWLLLAPSYAGQNLRMFLYAAVGGPVLFAMITGGLLFRTKWLRHQIASSANQSKPAPLIVLGIFAAAGPLWITIFHLFYAFPEGRFHMPLVAILTVIAAGLWGRILSFKPPFLMAGLSALILLVLAVRIIFPAPASGRYHAARQAADVTPADAVIIATGQLVFWEPLVVRNTERQLIPLSRSYEYAGKIIAEKKVEDPQPPPMFFGDHLCAGLLAGGARYAVPKVALERVDELVSWASEHRLYLDTSELQTQDAGFLDTLKQHFLAERVGDALYRLIPHDIIDPHNQDQP